MEIKMNFKMILLVLIILAVFLIPSYVFAAEDLNDFFNTGWEDLTGGDGTDGTGTNGAGTNGAGTDGAGANGAGTDGAGTDGAGTDGAGANGAGTDGAGTNGAGANKNQNNNKKPESYDKAGIAEDTMMVIAVITLIMIAICAYNKVNEYKGR